MTSFILAYGVDCEEAFIDAGWKYFSAAVDQFFKETHFSLPCLIK